MTYQQLIQYFKDNSTKQYQQFSSNIVNGNVPMIGCSTPTVRKVAKNFNVEQASTFPINEYYEVDLLKGIVISTSKLSFDEKRKYFDVFVDTIENWAVCDCSVVKVPELEKEEYFDYFVSLTQSDKTFVCRYGVVNLMSNYLCEQYVEKVFDVVCQIKLYGEYYVDMSVAWLVATAMAKCRSSTINFMESKARKYLSVFCYNRALQKMRDSFRVTAQDKQWTYTQKR